jgi:hypothetical protein
MNSMLNRSLGWLRPMKTKIATLASLGVAGAAAAALLCLAPQTGRADHGDDDSNRGDNAEALVGTWLVQVTLDPATVPPNTPFLNFTSIETFNAGGGYLESNNGPAAGGPGGQGNWAQTGHHRFAVTELRLGFDTTHAFTALNKIRRSLTISGDGNEISGNVQTDIFVNGTLAQIHPAGTFHGSRVPIEPLSWQELTLSTPFQ